MGTNLRCRRADEADVEALIAFPDDPGLRNLERDQMRADFAAGRMRARWSWLIEDAGVPVGRALWWGRGETVPSALDTLDVLPHLPGRRLLAAGLLRAGHEAFAAAGLDRRPGYRISLAPGWRQDEQASAAVRWRSRAAVDSGLSDTLERRQYAWTPAAGVPAPGTRLSFRPGPDEEFLELFVRAAPGSLDVGTRRGLAVLGPAGQAQDDLDFYLSCPGERDWWRVALDNHGAPAGFIIPSATPYHRNVGFLAVLPGHRGQSLVDDLLREITRFHAAAGAERITATTDLTNLPMAAAFERGGYENDEIRLMFEQPG